MRRTFIVLAVCGNKLVVNPVVVLAEDNVDAVHQAAFAITERVDPLPARTEITCYDSETDVIYVGKPTEEEAKGHDEKMREEDGAKCRCAFPEDCAYLINGECEKLGAKPCAESLEMDGTYSAGGDRLYEPGELLFAITPYDNEMMPEVKLKFVVYLTTKECWENEHGQSDDLGGHNVSAEALAKAGICQDELQESIFEVNYLEDDTELALAERMIEAGFGYAQAFQNFINKGFEPRG